jgi:hypothetical protein
MMRVPVKYKPVVEAFLQHLDKGYSVPFDHTLLVEDIETIQNGTHRSRSIPVTDTSLFDDGTIGVGSLLKYGSSYLDGTDVRPSDIFEIVEKINLETRELVTCCHNDDDLTETTIEDFVEFYNEAYSSERKRLLYLVLPTHPEYNEVMEMYRHVKSKNQNPNHKDSIDWEFLLLRIYYQLKNYTYWLKEYGDLTFSQIVGEKLSIMEILETYPESFELLSDEDSKEYEHHSFYYELKQCTLSFLDSTGETITFTVDDLKDYDWFMYSFK